MTKLIFISLLVLISACSETPEVLLVKGGQLDSCPSKTVEQMVDGFMNLPSWSSLTADDGNDYVNITGGITYDDKPIEAAIQYKVVSEERFEFNALEFNGIPQNPLVADTLLTAMCEEDSESSSEQSNSLEEYTSSELGENVAKADGLTAMAVSDVMLDYESLIGKKLYVRGFFFSLTDELNYLYEEQGSTNFILIDKKKLIREDRKFILKQCGAGCTAGFVGVLKDDDILGKIIIAEKIIK
jgi:hypothetical protein